MVLLFLCGGKRKPEAGCGEGGKGHKRAIPARYRSRARMGERGKKNRKYGKLRSIGVGKKTPCGLEKEDKNNSGVNGPTQGKRKWLFLGRKRNLFMQYAVGIPTEKYFFTISFCLSAVGQEC